MTDNTMPKAYDFASTEERLYKWWEENGYFKPEVAPRSAKPFTIAIPPPNVTGALHQGHALFVALEDLMIRRKRMQGYAALWIPGTDHAGIATQLQVEKLIMKEHGQTKHEYGREEFLARTWEWKREYGGRIQNQLRRLGASCDWERERFTLDEGLNRAVREAFVRMYRMGMIYKAARLVNWSPGLQTAVSDLEVEYADENGFFYHFNYPLKDGGHVEVATTRPETILGDTALAVHPDDDRYKHLIGKTAIVPMIGREIPIVADEYVEMDKGTGALKVTPAHDPNDFEIGQRHGLDILNVMNKDATMNGEAGEYEGLDRFDCRKKLWADMEEAGLTVAKKPHRYQVPRSQRGGEVIEPMVSAQWWVDAEPMAKMGLEAVRQGRINIVPERFNKTWENWLTNIRPWCISRQLWWGHRIPIWYVNGDMDKPICARDEEAALKEAKEKFGDDVTLVQDPDVLDTWFSSGLWPFSTLGWPDETADLKRFYPTDVLETGHDILFFWVARMVMTGLLLTNDIPFHTIYLHGLVRDEKGKKMSKSTGNVVDPIEVMEQYGTDALRFTLLTAGSAGNDMNLSMEKIASNRNFANKLWNATRFILSNMDKVTKADKPKRKSYTDADKWILTRLNETITTADRLLDGYNFGEAGRQIHGFLWGDFTDWYVEIAKVQMREGGARAWTTLSVLTHVMDSGLRLLHPFIPFVTEETWQQLKAGIESADIDLPTKKWADALIIADWPTAGKSYAAETADFARVIDLIRAVRSARADNGVEPGKRIAATIAAGDHAKTIQENLPAISMMARLDEAQTVVAKSVDAPESAVTLTLGDMTAYLPLAGMVDLSKERERLTKEAETTASQIKRISGLLKSPFAQNAPDKIVQQERDKLANFEAAMTEIETRLKEIGD